MGFKSPLDIGGICEGLERGNKCRACGRDNRVGGDFSRIKILQSCQSCGKPLIWEKTDSNGERQEYEWINGKGIFARKSRSGNKPRIRTTTDVY